MLKLLILFKKTGLISLYSFSKEIKVYPIYQNHGYLIVP